MAAGSACAAAMGEPLALLVRSPTQRHPDLRLRAGPAWTVRRLKAELRRLVPEAPVSAPPPPTRCEAPLLPPARPRAAGRAGSVAAEQRRELPRGCGPAEPSPAPRGRLHQPRGGYSGTPLRFRLRINRPPRDGVS